MAAEALVALRTSRRGGAVGRDVPQAPERASGRPEARRSEGVARGARRPGPRRRLDRLLPPRARGASVEGRARGVDRAAFSRRRRRRVSRRDPDRPRRAEPRGRRDAGPRARARRGPRLLGGDVQRAARSRRRPRGRFPGAGPPTRSPSVPELPAGRRVSNGNITERLAPLDGFPPFASVADAVDPSGDPGAFLSDLTETFASVYLASVPPGSVITFLHGVTGPAAVRTLLPYVSADERARLLRYTWQACASFASSNGFKSCAPPRGGDAALARRARRPRDRDRRRARHQVHGRLLPRIRAEPEAGLRPGGDGRRRAARAELLQRRSRGNSSSSARRYEYT